MTSFSLASNKDKWVNYCIKNIYLWYNWQTNGLTININYFFTEFMNWETYAALLRADAWGPWQLWSVACRWRRQKLSEHSLHVIRTISFTLHPFNEHLLVNTCSKHKYKNTEYKKPLAYTNIYFLNFTR